MKLDIGGSKRRARFTSMLIVVLSVSSIAALGCDSKNAAEGDSGEEQAAQKADEKTRPERTETINGVEIVYESGKQPSDDTVLASAGDIEVTLADFEIAMKRSLLVAPRKDGDVRTEVPPERLAVPHTQISVVRRLLAGKVIEQAAKKRGIEVTAKEKAEALETHPRLSEYADLVADPPEKPPSELAKLGLGVEDLAEIAEDRILRQKLRDELLAEIDDDDLWEAYKSRNDTVKLVLAWVRNTPSSATIDSFVAQQKSDENSEIEQHFNENKRRYRRPKMLEAVLLKPPAGEEVSEDTLATAAERLEDEADYEQIAEDLGLELEERARLVRQENKEAFGAEVGTTGYQTSGPRGAYAWRVTGYQESEDATLTSGLRRQIAAELLREIAVVPTAASKLTKLRRAMKEAETDAQGRLTDSALEQLREKAESMGLKFVVTEDFPLTPRGYIPGVGLAQEVSREAKELTMDQPLAPRPILSRGKAYVVRLQDRHVPTREEFERNKESFRERYIAEKKRKIVQEFVARWENEHEVQMDMRPLRVKYGVAQKDK
jgi:hypothetical protein